MLQDILKHVSKRAFDELMCADQLTRERHKRKAFLNFSEFQFTTDTFSRKLEKITVGEKNCNAATRTNESRISCLLCLSHSVLSLFMLPKMKRKSLFPPPTGTSGGPGTATCGRNTRLQEWVICFSREIQEESTLNDLQLRNKGRPKTLKKNFYAPESLHKNVFEQYNY